MFTIQNCGKSKQICNPAVLKKIWEWPQKFQGPEKQTFLDCDVSLLPSKTKKVIIITFSVLIMEKKGLEWSQGLKKNKHTLLFSRQKEPEMIDRCKTLTMISRDKISYEGKAQQLGKPESSTFSLVISMLGGENRRELVAIATRIWILDSCLVLCCL